MFSHLLFFEDATNNNESCSRDGFPTYILLSDGKTREQKEDVLELEKIVFIVIAVFLVAVASAVLFFFVLLT